MIVKALVDPNDVTTYHTEPGVPDSQGKVDRIKATQGYIDLKADIEINGITDPLLGIVMFGRDCFVEIGEQRILIARELLINPVTVIFYTKRVYTIPFTYEEQLSDLDQFSDCPAKQTLEKYIAAGIACY